MQCYYLFIYLIFSDTFIYSARNFHSRRTLNEKPMPISGAGKWSRLMAPVSGACVMGLRVKKSTQWSELNDATSHLNSAEQRCF